MCTHRDTTVLQSTDTDLPQQFSVWVFIWHGLCGWGNHACTNALLLSGEVWSEFTWSWSCDANQRSGACMPRRDTSLALCWLGVSMPPQEAAQELPTQGCSGQTNAGKNFHLISNYLPVSVWTIIMTLLFSLLSKSQLSKAVSDPPELWEISNMYASICTYTYYQLDSELLC